MCNETSGHLIMKKLLAALPAAILVITLSQSIRAETLNCETINCDCTKLPSTAWQDVCRIKQQNLQATCRDKQGKVLGYCSVHGPAANRVALSLDLSRTSVEQSNSVSTLNNKFAAIYWSMHQDIEITERYIKQQKYSPAQQRINRVQANLDTLFDLQKNMVSILEDSGNRAKTEQSWRNFAEDTEAVSDKLASMGNKLLDSADSENANSTAIALLQAAGNIYEHAGYGYAKGIRHKMSAHAWKKAADSSADILNKAHNLAQVEQQNYRYQAATRLHRASYNWLIAIDKKSAQEALVESQQFVDDSDANIEKILNNPELISSY